MGPCLNFANQQIPNRETSVCNGTRSLIHRHQSLSGFPALPMVLSPSLNLKWLLRVPWMGELLARHLLCTVWVARQAVTRYLKLKLVYAETMYMHVCVRACVCTCTCVLVCTRGCFSVVLDNYKDKKLPVVLKMGYFIAY